MRPNVGSLIPGSGRSGASSPGALRSQPAPGRAAPADGPAAHTQPQTRCPRGDGAAARGPHHAATPTRLPAGPSGRRHVLLLLLPPGDVRGGSGVREPGQAPQDRGGGDRLLGRGRREPPGSDAPGRGRWRRPELLAAGNKARRPVRPSARRAWRLPGKQGPEAGTGSGPPARRFPSRLRGPSGRLASRGAFLMGPTCVPHPDRGPGPGLAVGPGARRRPALNLERVREGRRGGVASARGASGRAELFVS